MYVGRTKNHPCSQKVLSEIKTSVTKILTDVYVFTSNVYSTTECSLSLL
jgi:hypothetical protein